jgi:hypothetical protein
MKAKIKVAYTFKDLNKESLKYGLVRERTNRFHSIHEAMDFVRRLQNVSVNGIQLIGKPIIEA